MKRIVNIMIATAFVAAFTSCAKKDNVMNGVANEHVYVEFGVTPDGSKINYSETGAFTWSATDELSCYAGTMQNAKFYNKNNTVAQQAVFACADAENWGTADFFVMYPYRADGYTMTVDGVTMELPTTLTVGENNYDNTFMVGCAKNVTPVTLAAQSITMRQVCGIVRVKMPAVDGMKPVTVTISDRNSEDNYSKSVTINSDLQPSYDNLVRCLIYDIEGGSLNTEAIVNVPVFQKNESDCEITVLYANADNKIRKIYTRQVSTKQFMPNNIYNIGFNGIGDCAYDVYDWIQVNPGATNWSENNMTGWNYINTGLFFNQDYYVTLTVKTESFQHNRWYMGYRWSNWAYGLEIGEYEHDGHCYCVMHTSGTSSSADYIPYTAGLKTFTDVKLNDATASGGTDKAIFFLNRGADYEGTEYFPEHTNTGISDHSWYSFKCYSLKIWERTGDEKGQILVYYIPADNKAYGKTMFDVVSGRMCEVKAASQDFPDNKLTAGND